VEEAVTRGLETLVREDDLPCRGGEVDSTGEETDADGTPDGTIDTEVAGGGGGTETLGEVVAEAAASFPRPSFPRPSLPSPSLRAYLGSGFEDERFAGTNVGVCL